MRGMTMTMAALAMGVLAGSASLAVAQSSGTATDIHPGQTDSGMNGKVIGAGSGTSSGAAGNNAISAGQGGVAGTGLGKTPAGNSMGTGQSVKGPAGQGITNSTDSPQ